MMEIALPAKYWRQRIRKIAPHVFSSSLHVVPGQIWSRRHDTRNPFRNDSLAQTKTPELSIRGFPLLDRDSD
jgi:hypothetical protein